MAITLSLLGHGILFATVAGGWKWISLEEPLPEIEFRGDSRQSNASVFIPRSALIEAQLVRRAAELPQQSAPTENELPSELEQPSIIPQQQPEPVVDVQVQTATADTSLESVERSLLNLKADLDRFIVYPPLAKQYEVEGRVIVSFQLNRSGTISQIHIAESSGYKALDDEVIRALRELSRNWRYNGSPDSLASAPIDVVFPVDFKLIRE